MPPPSNQPAFAPAPVLWSNVNKAEEKLDALRQERLELISGVRSLRKRQKELEQNRLALAEQSGQAVLAYNDAAERLRIRAIVGYAELSSGNTAEVNLGFDLTSVDEAVDQQRKTRYLTSALSVDRETMADFVAMRSDLDADAMDLVDHSRAITSALRSAERAAEEIGIDVDQAIIEAEAFRAGSEIYIDGVTFPIAGNYSTPLIDSFGFPRMPGTPDAHWHEGIDLFAPRGTPLVAAERAVVARIGNGRLGGLKFWLRGESGADWYYAHLDSFAPGLHNGQLVEAGELLGYVGNTGNAIGTPPHLHLEIHPGGGRPINPYPLLRVVSDLELDALAAGVHPGFRYQPQIVSRSAPVAGAGQGEETTDDTTDSTEAQTGETSTSEPAGSVTSPPTTVNVSGSTSDSVSPPDTTAPGPSTTDDSSDKPQTTVDAVATAGSEPTSPPVSAHTDSASSSSESPVAGGSSSAPSSTEADANEEPGTDNPQTTSSTG